MIFEYSVYRELIGAAFKYTQQNEQTFPRKKSHHLIMIEVELKSMLHFIYSHKNGVALFPSVKQKLVIFILLIIGEAYRNIKFSIFTNNVPITHKRNLKNQLESTLAISQYSFCIICRYFSHKTSSSFLD